MNRRQFLHAAASTAAALAAPALRAAPGFRLTYALASSLYGNLPLAEVVAQTALAGALTLDLWPKVHGTQREELDAMGVEAFAALLQQHGVRLGGTTRFDLGPFRLGEEMKLVHQLGGTFIVCGAKGNAQAQGGELKAEMARFAEALRPHAAQAQSLGVTLAVENHAHTVLESPDALRWLAEMAPAGVGIALAPYHLPQDALALSGLIRDLGPKLTLFYAWQYGQSCAKPMPKAEELEQLPGRGRLDFRPLLQALQEIRFQGPTEIFMHPTPRGLPILPTAAEVTAEVNQARAYLNGLLA